MKQILLVFTLALITLCAAAQNKVTYVIGKTHKYSEARLDTALKTCILDQFRRQDRRVTMHFDDSTTVVLFSADELKAKGLPVRENIIDRDPDIGLESIFIITDEGYVLQQVHPVPSLNEQKLNTGSQIRGGK